MKHWGDGKCGVQNLILKNWFLNLCTIYQRHIWERSSAVTIFPKWIWNHTESCSWLLLASTHSIEKQPFWYNESWFAWLSPLSTEVKEKALTFTFVVHVVSFPTVEVWCGYLPLKKTLMKAIYPWECVACYISCGECMQWSRKEGKVLKGKDEHCEDSMNNFLNLWLNPYGGSCTTRTSVLEVQGLLWPSQNTTCHFAQLGHH